MNDETHERLMNAYRKDLRRNDWMLKLLTVMLVLMFVLVLYGAYKTMFG